MYDRMDPNITWKCYMVIEGNSFGTFYSGRFETNFINYQKNAEEKWSPGFWVSPAPNAKNYEDSKFWKIIASGK